jgi:hypothetical protein
MFIKFIKSERFSRNKYFGCLLKCDNCNNEIIRKVNKSLRYKHHFCCLSCRDLYKKENPEYQLTANQKRSEALKGNKSYLWKGGIRYYSGYIATYKPDHPYCNKAGYVMEHRLVMEKAIERYLLPKERVHHINHIKKDNRIENLMLFKNDSEHTKYEWYLMKEAI